MNNNLYPSNNFYNNSEDRYAYYVLKNSIGSYGYFYVSFPDSVEWRDKIFYGKLIEAGNDYVIVYSDETGEYNLIWSIYLNYVTFNSIGNT